ncbi:MAG: hypothetical protein ACR2PR_06905 [Pseudohongiellaceae bacterium]
MAEVEFAEEEFEEVDDDQLPDGVEPEPDSIELYAFLDDGNLVEMLGTSHNQVAGEVSRLYDLAKDSMEKWRKQYDKALKLAKLEPEAAHKTFPFEGASNVIMPFILETMLDFHSRTVPELVWRDKVVSMKTNGKDNPEKEARAKRTGSYMNYQVKEVMTYWRTEQDKMLLQLPCVGTAYKESYFNGTESEVNSDLLMADEVVFDHNSRTFAEAMDVFVPCKYSRSEVIEMIRGDQQWQLEEEDFPDRNVHPEDFEFIRAFTWIDLDNDGLPEPYRVIYYPEKEMIAAVFPAYDEEGIHTNEDGEIVKVERMPIFTQYRFLPDPEGGPMGMGWGILLCDMFDAINTTFNQMIDAGTLSNLAGNSGLIDAQMSGATNRGNRQQAGPIDITMGELTPITTGGKSLRDGIVQFPYQGPNQTLFQLTEYMITQLRQMTNSALNMDTNSQEAAIMYLARLQQGLKVPNSIVMRVYDCAKMEFKKIALLNFKHHDSVKYNRVLDENQEANMRNDFNPEDCDISTAVDPSQGSDVEQQSRADILLQEAKEDQSNIIDKRAAYLNWLEALGFPDPDQIAPPPSGEPDPMQQMMMANMQREASLANREMNIKEIKLELDRYELMMKAQENMGSHGMAADMQEVNIAHKYAETFKLLWEIGMLNDGDAASTVEGIEQRFIDKQSPSVPIPQPVEFQLAQKDAQQQQGQAPQGAPTQ